MRAARRYVFGACRASKAFAAKKWKHARTTTIAGGALNALTACVRSWREQRPQLD